MGTASNDRRCSGYRCQLTSCYFCDEIREKATKPLTKRLHTTLQRVKITSFTAPKADIFRELPPCCFRPTRGGFAALTNDTKLAKGLGSRLNTPTRDGCKTSSDPLTQSRGRGHTPLPLYKSALPAHTVGSILGFFAEASRCAVRN